MSFYPHFQTPLLYATDPAKAQHLFLGMPRIGPIFEYAKVDKTDQLWQAVVELALKQLQRHRAMRILCMRSLTPGARLTVNGVGRK
jgi:hypothetical protein